MKSEKISELTTSRLSVYLRCLNALHSAGIKTISSQALAEQFHLNAAQIRKDLAYFGEFGVRGVGYYVKDLKRHLRQILGLDRKLRVAVMGADKDYGIRMYGLPSGYEFGTLIEAILDVSRGDSGLSPETRAALKDVTRPVHLQVFSTPT